MHFSKLSHLGIKLLERTGNLQTNPFALPGVIHVSAGVLIKLLKHSLDVKNTCNIYIYIN